ncbi:MAG: hypothetical protein JW986_08275 [Methanotrichaceae archaeon]|nr:hypothetical protein [Methanotrichaceae archaeon]
MSRKIFTLAFLLVACIALAEGQLKAIPASDDLYLDLGTGTVCNTVVLRCELVNKTITALPVMQFNLSGENLSEDGIAILALKSVLVERRGGEQTGMASLTSTHSWSENATPSELEEVFHPIMTSLREGFGSMEDVEALHLDRRNEEGVFAFDVTRAIHNATAERISFVLVPINEADYRVAFRSRETGSGPSLLLIEPFGPTDDGLLPEGVYANQSDDVSVATEPSLIEA